MIQKKYFSILLTQNNDVRMPPWLWTQEGTDGNGKDNQQL